MNIIDIAKKYIPPRIKRDIKIVLCYFLRFLRYGFNFNNIKKDLLLLSDTGRPTFFGYHDKTPFSIDNTKILAMSVYADDKLAENECTLMNIGYFNFDGITSDGVFHKIAETTTWCWQQGCMLQWHPADSNNLIIFNKMVNKNYGSEVWDVTKKIGVDQYQFPIYSMDPNGKYAANLNFSRLGRLRPGYGYRLLPDATQNDPAPDDDGLFLLDLSTGNRTLVASLSQLADDVGEINCHHYINHATFSPDGEKIAFFHLWSQENDVDRKMRFCVYNVLKNTIDAIESNGNVSHYCWKNSKMILASVYFNNLCGYFIYNVCNNTKKNIHFNIKNDGHPMYHPSNNQYIVTDTYPNIFRNQKLYIANTENKKIMSIKNFYTPFCYDNIVRCDLHPRWDRTGENCIIDSTINQPRKMAIINL